MNDLPMMTSACPGLCDNQVTASEVICASCSTRTPADVLNRLQWAWGEYWSLRDSEPPAPVTERRSALKAIASIEDEVRRAWSP